MKTDALKFLRQQNVAVIATAYRKLPYAAVAYYVVDDQFNFYFATTKNTDQYFNLKSNHNVAIVVGTGPKHISVQARGEAILQEGAARETALQQLEARQREARIENWPLRNLKRLQSKNHDNIEVVYKVHPHHLVLMNLDDTAYPRSLSHDFHQIIPAKKAHGAIL